MLIERVYARWITIPFTGTLRHRVGVHRWNPFTVIVVETSSGEIGYGETSGSIDPSVIDRANTLLRGHDPIRRETLRQRLSYPIAPEMPPKVVSAIEVACLDAVGKAWGVPMHALIGGSFRSRVEVADYVFFRGGNDPVETVDEVVADVGRLRQEHGFSVHKLKGGVFSPAHEAACYNALVEAFPDDRFRYDPNCASSLAEATRFGKQMDLSTTEYIEDPVFWQHGLRLYREAMAIPVATNTLVTDLVSLAATVRDRFVDVVLLDMQVWGGVSTVLVAGEVCQLAQLGVAVHSSGETGIQLAANLHLAASRPWFEYAIDQHYQHLADDILVDGKLQIAGGSIAVPIGPGLGVEVDLEKLSRYEEVHRETTAGQADRYQDPARPDWYPTMPEVRWAPAPTRGK